MSPRDTITPTRRRLLAGIGGALGAVTLAGCTSTDDDDSGEGSPTSDDPGEESPTSDDSEEGSPASDGEDGPAGEGPADGAQSGDSGSTGQDPSGGSGGDTDPPEESGDESSCPDESVHESYDETAVTVTTPDGERLGSVTAAIAETPETQRTGLSETDCLPQDRGMLFVYETNQSLGFWMKNMDIGIDIVHVDSGGVITSIQHAEAPADDESGTEEKHQYPGTGQFVLEVNYGWTTERSIGVGDVLLFDL